MVKNEKIFCILREDDAHGDHLFVLLITFEILSFGDGDRGTEERFLDVEFAAGIVSAFRINFPNLPIDFEDE